MARRRRNVAFSAGELSLAIRRSALLELLLPREGPLKLGQPSAHVQLHAEVPEAHSRRIEHLEQIVRTALLAHLPDTHDVEPEGTRDLHPELARHVREDALG